METKLKRNLKAYSVLAGAALTAGNAKADIIYTDINDVTFSNNGQFYDLDLNNDGTPDFRFNITKSQFGGTYTTYYGGTSYFNFLNNTVNVEALNNNEAIVSQGYYGNFVKALNLNTPINQLGDFANGTNNLGSFYSFTFSGSGSTGNNGSWGNQTNKYVGLKLNVSGKIYYGWVRLDVAIQYNSFTVKDYGYQDCSGLMIKAGDPGNTPADVALNVNAADVANIGSASDMQISFTKAANESTISEYRIMVVKAAQVGTFNINTAKNVNLPNYIVHIPDGNNFLFNPASNQKDVDGDAILQNVAYKVFVLSIPNGNTSTALSLAQQAGTVTLTMNTSIGEFYKNELNVFSSDKLITIECNNPEFEKKEWYLFNNVGQQVMSSQLELGRKVLDFSNLSAGVYFFKTNTEHAAIKLILQ